MLTPGTRIGRYIVQSKLAEGGMAELYRGTAVGPEGFTKDVVLKLVRTFLSGDPGFVQMFIAEAKLASRLSHANIVHIFDFGKHEDAYFIAMEYVAGISLWDLRRALKERGEQFPYVLAAEIAAQVARGLHHAHTLTDQGKPLDIVHRDVTPHNVLLSHDGAVKLTDFGIAKASSSVTAPGMLKGKFAYMSPEQARGESVDARSDVFALGVLLWEMITGGRLFEAESDMAVLRAVQESFITPPSRLRPQLPPELDAIVLKALARPVSERYQSAWELDRALSNFVLKHAKSAEDTSVAAYLACSLEQLPQGTSPAMPTFTATPAPTGSQRELATPQPTATVPSLKRLDAVAPTLLDGEKLAALRTDELPDYQAAELPMVTVEEGPPSGLESVTEQRTALRRPLSRPLPNRPAPLANRKTLSLAVLALVPIVGGSVWWTRREPRLEPVALEPIALKPLVPIPTPTPAPAPAPAPAPDVLPASDTAVDDTAPVLEPPKPAARRVAKGRVRLEAVPFAEVFIDNRPLGEVQGVKWISLSIGAHTVVFKHPRTTLSQDLKVEAGRPLEAVFHYP